MMVPFGSFAPDRTPAGDILVGGQNVLVRTDGTFCPWLDFTSTYTAIATRCQGGFYFIDSSSNTSLWAGTATKLYKLTSGTTFSDVSRAAPYALISTEMWEFAQYGQRIFATQIADTLQSFLVGTSAIFADVSGAPKAKHIATVANFLMLGNTTDGTYGAQPDGLWWSAIADPTNWPTVGTSAAAAVQSGRVNISGSNGHIQAIVPRVGTLDAVVVQERGISRCTYVGSPEVFSLQPMEGAKGTPAPNSLAQFGDVFYYLGEDGFYVNDGTSSRPIGVGLVDEYFYENVNAARLDRVQGVVNPAEKIYIVGYPSNASSGDIDRLLVYNWAAQKWAPPITVNLEFLVRYGSVGYTLEDLDAFGTVDSITTSFDSRAWTGDGLPVLAAFNTSHAAGFFSGSALEAILEVGDIDMEGQKLMTQTFRPIVEAMNATLSCSVGRRNTLNATVTYSSYITLNREDKAPIRVNSRYIRPLLKIAAGSDCQHVVGIDIEAIPVSNL